METSSCSHLNISVHATASTLTGSEDTDVGQTDAVLVLAKLPVQWGDSSLCGMNETWLCQ